MFSFSLDDRECIRKELQLEEKFIAIYAGIHGLAQNLETILETARLLQDNSKIHFLLIGDGPKKTELISLAASYNLHNLTFLPEKPCEQIPLYLSAADIALIPLRKAEVFKVVLPSKIFDAWSCERPVLFSIDGEAREMVETVHGGIFIPPEDPTKMAEALINLTNCPAELDAMGKNGHRYTEQNHSRKALAEKLILHLGNFVKD
jgi:glycosyltransferase involved in cell wall biosynthesis